MNFRNILIRLAVILGFNLCSIAAETKQPSEISKLFIGTWEGGRHTTHYLANGTFILSAPRNSPPSGRWRIKGNKLFKGMFESETFEYTILSITKTKLVIQSTDGSKFTLKRIP